MKLKTLAAQSSIVVLLLLFSLPAWAGFTRVQVASNATGSSGGSSLSLGSGQGWASSTAGNAIVVACGAEDTPAPAISDNKGDTYTLVTSVTGNTTTAILGLYVLANNPGGVTSIKCKPKGFTEITLMAMELSGAATASVIDRFSANDNGFNVPNPWTSNSTAAQSTAGDYAIGAAFEIYQGSQTFTPGSGWTAIATDKTGSLFLEAQNTVSGTSAVAATGNISNTTNARVIAIVATLKPGSGGGGGTTPNISGLSPTSGAVGTSVTITGTNFGSAPGTVTFNGTTATTTTWTSGSITVPVPNGATTGNVVVTAGGNASNGVGFTVTPAISSLSPTSGAVGTLVTITGTTFGSAQGTVTFNGTSATPTTWNAGSITVPVPNGATTGNVVVTTSSGNGSNGVSFTVIPAISSISPNSGGVGASVVITGSGFGSAQGTVTFNGTTATPTAWNNGSITVPVPTGATSGNVVVTAGGNASNGVSFTITPSPVISSVSPIWGESGTPVTIRGTNFGTAGGTVTFNGVAAGSRSWSSTSIVAPVPTGATTGKVVVTVNGGPSNGMSFTVPGDPPAAPAPSPTPQTIFVDRQDDPGVPMDPLTSGPALDQFCNNTSSTDTPPQCSLREAVIKSNNNAAPNTIMIPAGTFTLTIASTGFAALNATTGHLDVTNPVTIVGAGTSGANATIIQASTTLNDQVFLIDAMEESAAGFPVAIRNLVIEGGQANQSANIPNGNPNLGGVLPSGGAFEWEAGVDGNGQLTLTNVIITGNTATDNTVDPTGDDGGGIALFNTAPGISAPAQVTITGSSIQNNTAFDAGGGIAVKGAVSLTLSNSTLSGNNAQFSGTPPQGTGNPAQLGGGLFLCMCNNAPPGATSSPSQIQNSTISGNTAGIGGVGEGGGIYTEQTLTINQGSNIHDNTGVAAGGGIATNLAGASDAIVITSSTIFENNTSGNGGGIEVDSGSNANLTLNFNRIFKNSSSTGTTGVANLGSGIIAATDNWWGCDQGPSASPCDTASAGVTFSPWITLTNTASPSSVLNSAATTLTASVLQDSNQGALSVSNLGPLIGLAVTWSNPVNGTLSNQQTTIQANGTATASFTPNADPTASAQASIDQVTCQGVPPGTCLSQASITVQDFGIGPIPPVTVIIGTASTASFSVPVTASGGFNGVVTLSCVNPPPGIQCLSFTPPTITGSGTSTLKVTVPSAGGNYNIQVNGSTPIPGTSNTLNRNANANLMVGDYSLTTPSPGTQQVNAGDVSPAFQITGVASNGYTGTVTFTNCDGSGSACSVSGLPSGGKATFTQTSITVASGSTTNVTAVSLQVPPTTSFQAYNLIITGKDANGIQRQVCVGGGTTCQVTLNVAGFTLGASGGQTSITMPAGNSVTLGTATATFHLFAASQDGFNGCVGLSFTVTPGPANSPTFSLSDTQVGVAPGNTQVSNCGTEVNSNGQTPFSITITTTLFTTPGTYNITVNGGEEQIQQSLSLTLTVTAAPPLFILQDPAVTNFGGPSPFFVQGGLSVTTIGNFTGPVTFSLQYSGPALPPGTTFGVPTCIASQTCFNATPPYQGAVTVNIPSGGLYINDVFALLPPSGSSLPSGNYSITIIGTSPGQTTRQTTLNFSL